MSDADIILSQSEYKALLEEIHRLQARISELTALRDDLLYLERAGLADDIHAGWMLKNAISRYHRALEKLRQENRDVTTA